MAKQIPGVMGYLITTTGEIWSEPKGTSNPKGKWISLATDKDGYFRASLVCLDGKRRAFRVHRLVAITYVDNPNMYTEVNHIDGNKQNNSIDNLEWVSCSLNRQHAYDIKLQIPTQGILRKDNTSGYVGVSFIKGLYVAGIQHKGTRYWLGKFSSVTDAVVAYNTKAIELFGAQARINILKETDEEHNYA